MKSWHETLGPVNVSDSMLKLLRSDVYSQPNAIECSSLCHTSAGSPGGSLQPQQIAAFQIRTGVMLVFLNRDYEMPNHTVQTWLRVQSLWSTSG